MAGELSRELCFSRTSKVIRVYLGDVGGDVARWPTFGVDV